MEETTQIEQRITIILGDKKILKDDIDDEIMELYKEIAILINKDTTKQQMKEQIFSILEEKETLEKQVLISMIKSLKPSQPKQSKTKLNNNLKQP
jgi:uncharacterized protein with PIN domain